MSNSIERSDILPKGSDGVPPEPLASQDDVSAKEPTINFNPDMWRHMRLEDLKATEAALSARLEWRSRRRNRAEMLYDETLKDILELRERIREHNQ